MPFDIQVPIISNVTGSGLKVTFCRDMAGLKWSTPVLVDSDVLSLHGAGTRISSGWGALFTRRVGSEHKVYWIATNDPNDWSGSTEADIGLPPSVTTLRVYGVARNLSGVLCGLVEKVPVVSRDNGATWTASTTVQNLTLPAAIAANGHRFILATVSGNKPLHFHSLDGGITFK